jgi:hypothetical protein
MKGVRHFSIKGKLAPHYIGSYPITDKYGPLSYQVELPLKLSGLHDVFHVSQLKICLKPLTDIVIKDTIPLEPDLTYRAYPTKILDQQDRVTYNKTTRFYMVQWNDHSEDEATWNMKTFYGPTTPTFCRQGNQCQTLPLLPLLQSRDEIFFKGEGYNTSCYEPSNLCH